MKAIVPKTNLPRILIIGGGFGGIKLAKSLRKLAVQVVIIDRNNYHTFQPLLYQVATGGLEPDSIAFPLRKIFEKQDNLFFRMADVELIDPDHKKVCTSIGEVSYDYLVLATGSTTNFFGLEQVEAHALGMKTIPESLDLRSLILQNFEGRLNQQSLDDTDGLMKYVVVGGGPTGVETAGALAELKRFVLPNDYPELDFRQMEIHLIEAGSQLLTGMSEKASSNALKALEKLGVHVRLNTLVTNYDGEVVSTNQEEDYHASTVIWSAGITGNIIEGVDKTIIQKGGRLEVNEFNELKSGQQIYAIGDLAYMQTEAYPNGHPQVAQVAIQQGSNLAANFSRVLKKKELKSFAYHDKGSMATIGRNKAVVDFGNLRVKGIFAWFIWMFVHILFLIGFRNKLVVFVNWMWSYFTYDKGSRLIIRPFSRIKTKEIT